MRVCAEEGHRALGFRDVPVRPGAIGQLARACEPVVRQLFVERRAGDEAEFERKLYVIRRRIERAAPAAGVPEAEFIDRQPLLAAAGLQGPAQGTQLEPTTPTCAIPASRAPSRSCTAGFSTNTLGTWDLAHPFNLLAHNGEINTVRGNASWLAARQPQLRSRLLGADLQKLYPDRRGALVGLGQARRGARAAGDARPLAGARAHDARPAGLDRPGPDLADDVRAMCEYHAWLVEPWDGPAAIVATDGMKVVAALDRNGLRPARYVRTATAWSPSRPRSACSTPTRPRSWSATASSPAGCWSLDTVSGRLIGSASSRRARPAAGRTARGSPTTRCRSTTCPEATPTPLEPGSARRAPAPLRLHGRADRAGARAARRDGAEPVGSMGDDTPRRRAAGAAAALRPSSASSSRRSPTRPSTRGARRS